MGKVLLRILVTALALVSFQQAYVSGTTTIGTVVSGGRGVRCTPFNYEPCKGTFRALSYWGNDFGSLNSGIEAEASKFRQRVGGWACAFLFSVICLALTLPRRSTKPSPTIAGTEDPGATTEDARTSASGGQRPDLAP